MSEKSKWNFEVKKTLNDFVQGKIDFEKSKGLPRGTFHRIPDSGHPWVQVLEYSVDQLHGWLIVDHFDCVRAEFPEMSGQDVRTAVETGKAMFVTTSDLHCDLVTHRITDKDGLYRLKYDLHTQFGLTTVLYWQDDQRIETGVTTYCHTLDFARAKVEKRMNVLVHQIGTIADAKSLQQGRVTMNSKNTEIHGPLCHSKPNRLLAKMIKTSAEDLIAQVKEEEIVWGFDPETSPEMAGAYT